MKNNKTNINIGFIANIVMWVISGIIVLFGILFGAGIAWSMLSVRPQDYIVAVIVCFGFIIGGLLIAFIFISVFKVVSNMIFYSDIYNDYLNSKNKEKSDDE